MEKFKAVEKEMKTKAFSKEGLSAAAKLDPREREKLDACQFLSDMVDELERQVETLEAEEESLQATVKKGKKDSGKADRLTEIARLTEQHKWHQGKLELLLRALENGNVEVGELDNVKEGIKYYVEENQSVEFVDDDTLYDDFNLDADESAWGMNNEVERVSSHDAQSTQDDIAVEAHDSKPGPSITKQKSASTDPPAPAARRPSNTLKSPLPALATLHTTHTSTNTGTISNSMKPAPVPTRAPGEQLKYASAAAAAAASDKSGIAPLPPPPGPPAPLSPLPPAPSKASATNSPVNSISVPASTTSSSILKARSVVAMDQACIGSQSPTHSHGAGSSFPPTPALEKVETAGSSKAKPSPAPYAIQEAKETSPEPEQPKTPPPGLGAPGQSNGEPAIKREEESVYHLPSHLQDLMSCFDITKQNYNNPHSQATQRLLNTSYNTAPTAADMEKPKHYKPQDKLQVPSWYPQEPSPLVDDPALYSRIDTDTLFFIFYYRQGTYQQYLAAKALKAQSWRFHKQYQTWFQRHEEPKVITEDYEQGTYRFFDYESTW